MALKLIGAVGVKVRPEAEDFRDEAERQIKRQMGGRDKGRIPMEIDPEIDSDKLKREFAAAKKKLLAELKRNNKPVEFTTDIRFDTSGWKDAKAHLNRMEHEIRDEMRKTSQSIKNLDDQRRDSMRFARKLAQEHKKLADQAMRGTASGNDVAKVRGQYELVRESIRQTTDEIDRLKSRQSELNDSWAQWGRDSGRYTDDLRSAVRAHEDLIRDTAEAHRAYMAKVREDSNDLLGGLKYGIRKNVEDIKKALGSLNEKGTFGIKIDTEQFKSGLDHVKRLFHRARDDMDGEEVELKPTLDDSSYRIAWVRLKWLARDRIATIFVKVNGASARLAKNTLEALYGMSGARQGIDFIKDFGRYIRDLDKHVPTLGMIGTLAVSAMGGVIALSGSVSHLATEFVRLAGVGLALPGILGGFAVGIGAFITVLKDFNTQVPQIGNDLSDLEREMTSNFWKQAKVPLLEAWNKAFPHFSKGIQETSTALGNWTAAFSEAFATHFDMAAFDKMFDNLNLSIDIASLGVGNMVKAMSILGQTGSEYLPRLAAWSNDVARGFANWLEEAQKTGELNRIIETGIQKLKEFGVLTRESGELIYILGSAAERAGFSGFGEMSRGMERFNDALNSAKGQRVLDDLFQGAAKIADGFKRALGAVGDFVWNSSAMLNELMGIVGGMVGDTFEDFFKAFEQPKFQTGLVDFFNGIADAVGHISDSAPQISDLLGSIGSLAGVVAENMGDLVGTIVDAFGPDVSKMLDDLKGPMDDLGGAVSDLVQALDDVGAWDALVSLVSWAASGAVQTAADAIQGLADSIKALNAVLGGDGADGGIDVGGWAQGLNKLLSLIIPGFGLLTPLLDKIFEPLKGMKIDGDVIRRSFEDLLRPIIDLEMWLLEVFANLGAAISDAWNGFWDWLTGLFTGGPPSGTGGTWGVTSLLDGFGFDTLGEDFAQKIDAAREWILGKWEEFKGWLGSLFSGGGEGGGFQVIIDFVMNAIDYASQLINQVVATAQSWAMGIYQGILTALDNAGTTIAMVKDKALNYARGFYQAVLRALDSASNLIATVKSKAQSYASGMYRAVLRALDSASSTIANVRNKAVSYGNLVKSATLRAIDNASRVIDTIKSKIAGLKGKTISIVTNMVTKVKKIFSADGNLFPEVQKFANGGLRENHVAQIAPAGAMRVWAEPETGGEAYIPLAQSKRARSEQILASVADKFGMSVQKFANGSNPTGNSEVQTASGDTYNINVESVPTDSAEETTSAIMFNLKHMKRGGGLAFA